MNTVPRQGLTRRQLIGYSAAASAGLVLSRYAGEGAGATSAQALPAPVSARDAFTAPPRTLAPKFRWWWPNGEVDPAEIIREVDQVADAGFGGLEIADVHHSLPNGSLDIANSGWGSPRWCAGVEAALTQADARGISIDITLGPSWPAAVPTITPQSEPALTELAHGLADIPGGGTYSAALPEPVVAPSSGVTAQTLIGVHALRVVTRPAKGNVVLDFASRIDLGGAVSGTTLTWTAPDAPLGWVLLAYWQRGSGQQAEGGLHSAPTAYVVDHFSSLGARAVIDYWEATILTPRVRQLLARAGGSFFEDSLEIETHSTIWTRRVREEFQTRMGYDITPYLPVIIEQKEKYLFDFDGVKNNRIRDDYNQVLSDLYSEQHLVPLRDWAHSLGLTYRVQAYGLEQDSIAQAGIVDIPETESLGAKNLDDYRVLASGRDIAGHTILSCEAAAYLGKAYNTTWNQVLQTLGETFCGGVNQTVLHGFPYATHPAAGWPGFAAFSPYYNNAIGYSEAWGPRTPNWTHAADLSAFLTRTHWALQQGRPRYDIAFLRQKGWAQTGIGAPWATASGIPVGWTHGFLTGSSLSVEGAQLVGGRFAPNGGSYKAFIVDIDRFRGNEATLSPEVATTLRSLADAGFPLVLFGDWSMPESTGLRDAATNAAVAAAVAHLKVSPSVALAPAIENIPTALAALGVTPDVTHETSNLKHIRRVDGGVDYYYLVNARHNPAKDKLVLIDHDVTFATAAGDTVPYLLDAWTGRVIPVARFTRSGKRVRLRVRLTPGQSAVVAMAPRAWAGTPAPSVYVMDTTAASARFDGNQIELIADAAGTYTAALSTGRTKKVSIPALPDPISLPAWDLTVDDWQPVDPARAETRHVAHAQRLTTLVPWNLLPGLTDASGVGTYTTTVTLDSSWSVGGVGVHLDLGSVIDTFRVWINSQLVAERDLMDSRIDISRYVRAGRNTVRVEVTSTLLNRLRQVNPTVYGIAKSQDYGLLGPVTVRPYGVARVY